MNEEQDQFPQAPDEIPFVVNQQPETDGEVDDMSDDDVEGGKGN